MHTHVHSSRGLRAVATGAAVLAAAAAAILLSGAPAQAATVLPGHVHVDGDATAGTTSTLSFRVPTESDTASTVSLTVDVPAEALITSVTPLFKSGWDVEVVTSELNPPVTSGNVQLKSDVTRIVWTATAGGIPPEQYDEFTIRIGVPSAGTLVLAAHQGYSDGTVVDWADPANADGTEPAHPAPSVDVAAAASASPEPSDADTAASADDAGDPALGVSIAALVVGALGLIAAVAAIALRRRSV